MITAYCFVDFLLGDLDLDLDLNELKVTFWANLSDGWKVTNECRCSYPVPICISVCTGMLRIISEECVENLKKRMARKV